MNHKRILTLLYICLLPACLAMSQDRMAENRPYCDLRPFHFGVIVGAHLQDLEFSNVGPQTITLDDGTTQEAIVTCDQDRWEPGFNVGVLGEFRLGTYFALRIAPQLYFANRHITFRNFTSLDSDGNPTMLRQNQNLKTAYITCSCDVIYAAQRFNNHRPYIMAGVSPIMNLSTKANDYIQLKRSEMALEVGMGCDFYLPFFKLRPELKFMYSLGNCLNMKHRETLRDATMKPYTYCVDNAHTKVIALSFYFE